MRNLTLMACATGLAAVSVAQNVPNVPPTPPTTQAPAPKPSKPKKGKVTGEIEAYDDTTRTLRLKMPSASLDFPLASDAKVKVGGNGATVGDLARHVGARATVEYVESNGQRVGRRIRVIPAPRKPK